MQETQFASTRVRRGFGPVERADSPIVCTHFKRVVANNDVRRAGQRCVSAVEHTPIGEPPDRSHQHQGPHTWPSASYTHDLCAGRMCKLREHHMLHDCLPRVSHDRTPPHQLSTAYTVSEATRTHATCVCMSLRLFVSYCQPEHMRIGRNAGGSGAG